MRNLGETRLRPMSIIPLHGTIYGNYNIVSRSIRAKKINIVVTRRNRTNTEEIRRKIDVIVSLYISVLCSYFVYF